MPHGTVGGAEVVELYALQLLQCVLHGRAVLADDVGVVAHHFEPEGVAVDLCVDHAAVECAEAPECVTREEHVVVVVERHHRLGPVYHRCHDEGQRVAAQCERVAVLHFQQLVGHAVESLGHLEGLLVADNLDAGVVLLDEGERAAVVGLHVVYHQVVDGAFADDLADVLQILHEEVHLDGVDEADFLVDDEIGVVTYPIGQRPESLEEVLVAVVYADVVDVAYDFFHYLIYIIIVLVSVYCPVAVSSSCRFWAANSRSTLLLRLLQQLAENCWAQPMMLSHCCSVSPCSMWLRVMP